MDVNTKDHRNLKYTNIFQKLLIKWENGIIKSISSFYTVNVNFFVVIVIFGSVGLLLILTLNINSCFGCTASMFIISHTSVTTSIIAHHGRIDNQGIATYNCFIIETPFISGFCVLEESK